MRRKLFLAGLKGFYKDAYELKIPFVLESFFYAEDDFFKYIQSDHCKDYLFDSGAFTFMNSVKKKQNVELDFDSYLEKYINTINKYDLKNFFELDIDAVVGLKKVEELRERLERETGKKCIPVWHKERGKQYFLDLCQEYDYVSIGGIVMKDIKRSEWKFFNWFCEVAHKNNCKIHGLGFTPTKTITQYNFDTTDSTTWHNARFGGIFEFKDGGLTRNTEPDKRIITPVRRALEHNLAEWVKYQKYLYYGG